MSRQRLTCVLTSAALFTLALVGCEARYPPMPEVLVDPPLPTHIPASGLPAATDEGAGPDGSLLEAYASRSPRQAEDLDKWQLPFQAKTMIVEVLIAAAKDDPERMKLLLADNARWGVPDRRELRARPITHEDDPLGLEFLEAFRKATSRFGAKSSFTCTPLQPGWQMLAASGAEPVWCSYTSKDSLDIIGFRLIVEQGRVVTDYIGFFAQRQPNAIRVPEAGDPPNLTPYVKMAVPLTLPSLMPDDSNPVIEKKRKAEAEAVDEPIPVQARPADEVIAADESADANEKALTEVEAKKALLEAEKAALEAEAKKAQKALAKAEKAAAAAQKAAEADKKANADKKPNDASE